MKKAKREKRMCFYFSDGSCWEIIIIKQIHTFMLLVNVWICLMNVFLFFFSTFGSLLKHAAFHFARLQSLHHSVESTLEA